MTPPVSTEEIESALHANNKAPYGRLRTTAAERLVEAAAQTGDHPLTIYALQELISAYEFGGQADKALVPFARVLRMWDDNPADFNRWATHRLHWHFKWVCSGMLAHPNVALTAIRGWVDEMAIRYRRLGHGLHAVYGERHFVAQHIGDTVSAQQAFDEWQAAERDEMSDCQACERKGQGDWYVVCGDDREAIQTWEPVLAGELTCEEEPHRTLAASLLPLVRLGELGQARANHLRGYRMVRGKPDLRAAVGLHLEFAARTGNEARGLEMLSHHQSWLTRAEETAYARLSFLEGAAVLLNRLATLGHTELRIGDLGPLAELRSRVETEVAELGRRFDERNGTTAVSNRSAARLDATPLVESLSLGTRTAALAADPPSPVSAEVDLASLIAAAEELSAVDHPRAGPAWERVAAAGGELDPSVAVRVALARAVDAPDAATARARLLTVAEQYARLPDPARALVARGRAAAADGEDEEELAAILAEAAQLRAAGGLPDLEYLRLLLARALYALRRWPGSEVDSRFTGFEAATDELTRAATELGQPLLVARAASLRGLARHMAGLQELAVEPLTQAVDGFLAAGAPWHTVQPLFVLCGRAMAAGEYVEAEQYARAALRHGAGTLSPGLAAQLALRVAEACWGQGGRDDDVVDLALIAADRFDRGGGEFARASIRPRLLAAHAFLRSRRPAEAVAILEATVPELEDGGDPEEVVRAKEALFRGLSELDEHRDAARVILSAADVASSWPDQSTHASLAHRAGAALEAADLPDEAARAYARAAELWRQLGETDEYVRATRAQAWAKAGRVEPDWPAALALLEKAASATSGLSRERAETRCQLAQLLQHWASSGEDDEPVPVSLAVRALAEAERASTEFAAVAEDNGVARSGFLAAAIEFHLLGRPEAAFTRLDALSAAATARGDEATARRCEHTRNGYRRARPSVPPAS